MYRIDRIKQGITYLMNITKIVGDNKDKYSKDYILGFYTINLKKMKEDVEEVEKFMNFIEATKKKQQL